jgi:hypothetical protein
MAPALAHRRLPALPGGKDRPIALQDLTDLRRDLGGLIKPRWQRNIGYGADAFERANALFYSIDLDLK